MAKPRPAKANFKVKDRDRGMKEMMRRAREMRSLHVKVGVLQGKGAETSRGGITMAELSAIHEFGSPAAGIPERSHLRSTVDQNQAEYRDLIRTLAEKFSDPNQGEAGVRQALNLLGAKVAGDVQKAISSGIPPPNSPATIRRKGSSTPLVDTGQYRQSITWAVTDPRGSDGSA
jgi:hypothetical protein